MKTDLWKSNEYMYTLVYWLWKTDRCISKKLDAFASNNFYASNNFNNYDFLNFISISSYT